MTEQACYTLINFPSDSEPQNEMQLKQDFGKFSLDQIFGLHYACSYCSSSISMSLEKGDVKAKTEALKKTICMILNGEKIPSLLMNIIRFVLPLQDHMIKKLLLIFWEIVPKTTADGKLLHEMILVCDAYRKVS